MSDITNAAVEAATMTEEIEKIEPAAITIDEVETYDLPSTYDDYEGAPPAAPAPFRIADERDIPVILDTDSEVKAAKYQACGMEIEKDAILKSGVHMYTMIRRRKQS